MLKLKVTYFLTPEGLAYFSTWQNKVFKETVKQDGFIDMRCENDGITPVVYLSFSNQETLDLWASTPQHDALVSLIEPYFIKPEDIKYIN